MPGFGVDSAQQVIGEAGTQASTFPSAAQLTSEVGTSPRESARESAHESA